ncbi:MAG: histidine kinase, partial [Leptolyngbyaceae cyanobacterium CAN_BIN12]|nr:histidine kinase [Leptolyngbyaceae cyanobacterium CAN_BIN12]
VTTESTGSLSPAAKRTTALFLALVNHRALNLARVLDPNLATTLELARTLANIRTLESSYTEDNTPARSAIPTRALAIALTRSLPTRSMGQAITKTFTKTFTDELGKLQAFQATTLHELIRQLKVLNLRSPDIRQSATVLQEFHMQVFHTWFSTLKLDPTWISLSTEELRKLDRYLYANWLLVRCKQAAVRVSHHTWAGIESRLLRVSP